MRRIGIALLSMVFFGLLGPLIGGLPTNALIVPIFFSYAVGLGPALIAGLIYGIAYPSAIEGKPGALVGAAWGAGSGFAGTLIFYLVVPLVLMTGESRAWLLDKVTPEGDPSGMFPVALAIGTLMALAALSAAAGAFCGWLFTKTFAKQL